jgi:hypothetical protein
MKSTLTKEEAKTINALVSFHGIVHEGDCWEICWCDLAMPYAELALEAVRQGNISVANDMIAAAQREEVTP